LGQVELTQPAPRRTAAPYPSPSPFGRLSAQLPNGYRRCALRDVSLSIRAGEIVALVGESGSGKTTLAKLLAGLYRPSIGTIAWDGIDIKSVDAAGLYTGIAVIFQDFLRFHLRARDNVGLGRVDAIDDLDDIREAVPMPMLF
jgi:ATP-binding cassette subfamily B protein